MLGRFVIKKAEKQVKIIPGEMSDMDIDMISLVRKGANGQKIQIYKEDEEDQEGNPEIQDEDQGLLDLLKSYFAGKKTVNKADAAKATSKKTFAGMMAVNDITENMWRANDTLRSVMRDIINNEEVKDKKAALLQAVDEYSAYMKSKVNSSSIAKSVTFFDVPEAVIEKAGKKVSSKNLAALKNAQSALAAVIAEAEGEGIDEKGDSGEDSGTGTVKKSDVEEEDEVKKSEIADVMKSAMEEALKPINERLDKIEKGESGEEPEGEGGDAEGGEEATPDNIADVVKAAVSAALTPVNERLDKIEKSRGLSRSQEGDEPGNSTVKKSGEADVFDGLFV